MSDPGTSQALFLPSASVIQTDPNAGGRLHEALSKFLDTDVYRALAVVHGLTKKAATAFDLAKQRRNNVDGVVWVSDPDLLPVLVGDNKKILSQILKPAEGYLVTFVSISKSRVTGKLDRWEIGPAEFDAGFAAAEAN